MLGQVPTNQLYFDISTTPYTGYTFNRFIGAWEEFGGSGGGAPSPPLKSVQFDNAGAFGGTRLLYDLAGTNANFYGQAGTGADGTSVNFYGGDAASGAYTGGALTLHGGYGYNGGEIYARAGSAPNIPGHTGGALKLAAGAGYYGGSVSIYSWTGIGSEYSTSGNVSLEVRSGYSGSTGDMLLSVSGSSGGTPGDMNINIGGSTDADVGNIFIQTGGRNVSAGTFKGGNIVIQTEFDNNAGDDIGSIAIQTGITAGGANVGDIIIATAQNPVTNPNSELQPGSGKIRLAAAGELVLGSSLNILMQGLPSTDPALLDALWENGGFLALSGAGTSLTLSGGITVGTAAEMISSDVAFTNGAGVGLGTLTNAPAAGNPTKWIGIDDNGTLRYVPAW